MSAAPAAADFEKQIRNLNALLEVSKAMASETRLDNLLLLLVEKTTEVMDADRSSLFLYDEETNELWSKIAQGVELTEIRFPVGVGIAGDVAAKREGDNIVDAYDDPRFNQEFDKKTGYRTRSVLCLPMMNPEGRLIGVIQVLNKKTGTPFDEQDENLLGALGAHAAVALEQARLVEETIENERMQEALEVAQNIQMSLLPEKAPEIKGFDIYGWSVACDETGGDYYDFIEMSGGRLCIIIGDVSGHGLGAAMFMATARAAMRSIMMNVEDPAQILYQVNNRLSWDMSDETFMTLFFGVLDPNNRTFRYSSAGHEDPIIYRAADGSLEGMESTGLPLGMMEEMEFPEGQMTLLNEGDIVLLTTDGVFEAMNKEEEQMGHPRMGEVITEFHEENSQVMTERLRERTNEFMDGAEQRDDITIVTIKAVSEAAQAEAEEEDLEIMEMEELDDLEIEDPGTASAEEATEVLDEIKEVEATDDIELLDLDEET